jgi:O-antigen/teichoic acid export membrane protein
MAVSELPTREEQKAAGRFRAEVLWNVASLAIMGGCGILLNVLVGAFYDPGTLGAFNQVFAAYILFSQFAVGGIHYSALKYVAERGGDEGRAPAVVVVGALLPAALLAACFSALFWAVSGLLGTVLDSESVAEGIAWATPGLFLFAVNKVLLGVLNGQQRMKCYAVLQALRPLLLIATFLALGLGGAPGACLPVVFSAAEAAVFVASLVVLRNSLLGSMAGLWGWVCLHVAFGLRSFLSGVMTELNTRVDILLLGYFATDRVVGIYSLAAILAEGVFQLLVVLRNNFSPVLVRLIHAGEAARLRNLMRRGKLGTYALMACVGAAAVLLYPWGASLVGDGGDFLAGWPVFALLMGGIVLSAGYMPFGNLLLLAGRPGLHTLMTAGVVAFNAAGNALLIPVWGAEGSALATGAAFVFSALLLAVLSRAAVGIRV